MRRPRRIDFQCPGCDRTTTRLVETSDDDVVIEDELQAAQLCDNPHLFPADDEQPPGYCRAELVRIDTVFNGYMKTIVKGSHDFNERERERLEKRGDDHWKREGRHEAIERERIMLRKNGMEGAGGVR